MQQGGLTVNAVIEPNQLGTEAGRRRRALGFIGPVIDVDRTSLAYLTSKLTDLWDNSAHGTNSG